MKLKTVDINLSTPERVIHVLAKLLALFSLGFYILGIFSQHFNFPFGIVARGILLFVFFIAFSYFLSLYIKSDKAALFLIFFSSFTVLIIWNFLCDAQPVSDYEVLISGANSIIDGTFPDLAKEKDNYFYFYNFQIGYSFYLSIFLRLFNGSLAALKVVEILTITLTNVLVYKIMRLFFSSQISLFTSLLMTLNPYIIMGSGIINNQHISCLLCLCAMYIFLGIKDTSPTKYNLLKYALCGLLIALSQVLRPTTTVILIAFVICGTLYGVFCKNKSIIIGSAVLLVTYFVCFNLINLAFIASNIAPIGIKNSNSLFKIILGLTGEGITGKPTTSARHTQYYYDLATFNFDYSAYNNAAKEHLRTCFSENQITFEKIYDKMICFTGGVDNQYSFTNHEFIENNYLIVETMNIVGVFLYTTSILLSFIHTVTVKSITKNKPYLLWILIFGIFFFAYIIFETQTRYRYEQYYMLFFLSMPLFYNTIRKIHTPIVHKIKFLHKT